MQSADVQFVFEAFHSRSSVRDPRYSFRHALATAALVHRYNRSSREISRGTLDQLALAALGHDLLEDTAVGAEELSARWGPDVTRLIEGLTNRDGDADLTRYLAHLATAGEEIVLVKMADILSNLESSIRSADKLGRTWFLDFWIPLLREYERVLFSRRLSRYPVTMEAMCRDAIGLVREAEGLFSARDRSRSPVGTEKELISSFLDVFGNLDFQKYFSIGNGYYVLKPRKFVFRRLEAASSSAVTDPIRLSLIYSRLARFIVKKAVLRQDGLRLDLAPEMLPKLLAEEWDSEWPHYLRHLLAEEDWLIVVVHFCVYRLVQSKNIIGQIKADDLNRQWLEISLGVDKKETAKIIADNFWPKPH